MAGGRGTRIELREEKPLLRVGGRAMVERVIDALKRARKVHDIVVAVSRHTPKTAERLKRLSVKVLETPGEGYVFDIKYAVKKLGLGKVLTISADLPLITSEVVDHIIEHYECCGKPALTVASPIEVYEKLRLKPEYEFEAKGMMVAPVGVNVIDGERVDEPEMEEETLIINDERLAVNVNTTDDLELAERLL